jgi:hypothetical protein
MATAAMNRLREVVGLCFMRGKRSFWPGLFNALVEKVGLKFRSDQRLACRASGKGTSYPRDSLVKTPSVSSGRLV